MNNNGWSKLSLTHNLHESEFMSLTVEYDQDASTGTPLVTLTISTTNNEGVETMDGFFEYLNQEQIMALISYLKMVIKLPKSPDKDER